MTLIDSSGRPLARNGAGNLREAIAQRDASLELLSERLAELELAMEDEGWLRMELSGEREFSRDGLDRLVRLARLSYLKNPLINHAVNIQAHYVFGQGLNVKGRRPAVNDVVQAFWDERGNRRALSRQQALTAKEIEAQVTGNVVLALFPSRVSGRVRVRSIPVEEVRDIVKNPDDAAEPWYYLRAWSERRFNNGVIETVMRRAYYPDLAYRPRAKPATIGELPVHWGSPLYHVKVGAFDAWSFGVPEVYSALDWAKAVKEDLEDYLTIRRALARFVWRVRTPGGAKGVAAVKAKLGTTIGPDNLDEDNPPPAPGSAFIAATGMDLEPIRTAGATPSLSDGRRVGLMVAAGVGIPETMLFGDADVGNLATAKTLDRPTELQMINRQSLWRDVLEDLFEFVVEASVRATRGALTGTISRDPESGEELVVLAADADNDDPDLRGEPMEAGVDIDFPAILERDVGERVKAVATAATLDGKTRAGTLDDRTLIKLLLIALGEDDVDELVETILGANEEATAEAGTRAAEDSELAEAVKELREAIAPVFPAAA